MIDFILVYLTKKDFGGGGKGGKLWGTGIANDGGPWGFLETLGGTGEHLDGGLTTKKRHCAGEVVIDIFTFCVHHVVLA